MRKTEQDSEALFSNLFSARFSGSNFMRTIIVANALLALLAAAALPATAVAQFTGERSANSGIWSSPRMLAPPPALPVVETLDEAPLVELKTDSGETVLVRQALVPREVQINIDANARAAVIGDNKRLQDFSGGTFLPSSIPVPGDPYFGSDPRAMVQGSGNSLGLIGTLRTQDDDIFEIGTKFLVQNANFGAGTGNDFGGQGNVAIQQAYGRYNGVLVGLSETALADTEALPEILDLAGPNARVTALENGLGEGQGRFSYFLLQPEGAGTMLNVSIEDPNPEINRPSDGTPANSFDTFARCPDFLLATRYGTGAMWGDKYVENGHLQFGTVLRSLGLENEASTYQETAFGWGVALSGAYRFRLNPELTVRDAVFGSIAYGEGIARYIVDLRAQDVALNNNDAAVDASGNLVPLPALAWYSAYQHNWTNSWRSTATYSQVMLQSIATPSQAASPYHLGQYVQANLVYHTDFSTTNDAGESEDHTFFTGVEWTHGTKETLNGAQGAADRIMWVAAFTK